jgi:SAM-dependent methyltransferase
MKEHERWDISPAGIDEAELAWWEEFAELQDWLAWVQTPKIRGILRADYISRMLRSVRPGQIVVEMGCGTGWLLVELAQRGITGLIGTDFSTRQLAIAREQAALAGVGDCIRFLLPGDLPENLAADVVICHGFLHHLTKSEIKEVMEVAAKMLKPEGELLVLEPVCGSIQAGWWRLPEKMTLFFGGWGGLRPMSGAEHEARQKIKLMLNGDRFPGRGPSPKEMPFRVGEIEELASTRFQVVGMEPVMFFSWTVAARMLLLGLSYPRLSDALMGPVLHCMVKWERFALRRTPKELWAGWNFCLLSFAKKSH